MIDEVTITSLNENALLVSFGNTIDVAVNQHVISLTVTLVNKPFSGFIEAVPAYSSLAVFYDPGVVLSKNKKGTTAAGFVTSYIREILDDIEKITDHSNARKIEIPVLYDGEDLAFVADHHRLTTDEIVSIHTSTLYRVFMIGFLPGFAYMGTLDPRIEMSRKTSPRTSVPAGSVAIAGMQTGIYPQASPGGWQLIGRTPIKIFDTAKSTPCLLSSGDTVQFVAIDKDLFDSLNEY